MSTSPIRRYAQRAARLVELTARLLRCRAAQGIYGYVLPHSLLTATPHCVPGCAAPVFSILIDAAAAGDASDMLRTVGVNLGEMVPAVPANPKTLKASLKKLHEFDPRVKRDDWCAHVLAPLVSPQPLQLGTLPAEFRRALRGFHT